jgi:hypothetical protein
VTRAAKLALALIATGLIAAASGGATFAAFARVTQNDNDSYSAGTVTLSDNDAGSVMWDVSNQRPTSAAIVRCVRVTFTGSLTAGVRLYTTTASSALDPYLSVTVEKGSMPVGTVFPNCTGFVSEATISPTGTLQAFKAARTGWASGLPAAPGAQTSWATGDSLVYRFTVQVQNTLAAQGLTALVAFTWEAQNL